MCCTCVRIRDVKIRPGFRAPPRPIVNAYRRELREGSFTPAFGQGICHYRPGDGPSLLVSARLSAAAVELYFAVDRDPYELVGLDVFELHDLMAFSRQFSPAAGLVGILFDGLVLLAPQVEGNSAKTISAGAADKQALAGEVHRVAFHYLLSDGREERRVEHAQS